jgi:lipid II:glycine glycyltransferase (peptidoglycan interpeptide bridge formation enzyme)
MDFILTGSKKKEAILAALNYIMENSSRWDSVDLQEMPDTTGNFFILREYIKGLNLSAISGIDKKSFCISFRNINKGEFLKIFSKHIRRQFKNAKEKVIREINSEFAFKRFANTNGNETSLEGLVSEIERIEKASWKGKACSGLFSEASTKIFHNEIIKGYFKKGLIDISFLSIKNRNVAYQYNYFYNTRLYNYSAAYDTKYSRFSPGFVLQIYVLQSCYESAINEVDFLRGEENWKSRLTSDYKIHARTRIFNRTMYSKFLFILQSYILPYLRNKKIIYRTWIGLKKAAHVFKKRY